MSEDEWGKDINPVKKLIEKEKESALEFFKTTDFNSSLQDKISAGKRRDLYLPFWLRKPIPVLGLILVLICVGIIVCILTFSPSPVERSVEGFKEFFARSPALQRTLKEEESQLKKEETGEEKEFTGFSWVIKHVFLALHRKDIPDEMIPFLIYRVLQDAVPEKGDRFRLFKERIQDDAYLKEDLECLRDVNCRKQLFSQILMKLKEV